MLNMNGFAALDISPCRRYVVVKATPVSPSAASY